MPTEILLLQAAIQQLHHCEAAHLRTVFVHEKYEGHTMWKGDVEVFGLKGHPQATACYAWLHRREQGKGIRPVAFLNKWPVSSPETAVRTAIALDIPKRFEPAYPLALDTD